MNDLYRLRDQAMKASAKLRLIMHALEKEEWGIARQWAQEGQEEQMGFLSEAMREIDAFEATAPQEEVTNIVPGPLARLDKEFAVSYFVNGPHEVTVW